MAPRVKLADRPFPRVPDNGWAPPKTFPDLTGQGAIAIDVETWDPHLTTKGPGFQRGEAYIVGLAIGTEAGYRGYYPVRHEIGPNLDSSKVFGWAREQLRRPQPKIGANLLYDLEALASEHVYVEGPHWDVQNAEPLLDENKMAYDLDSLAWDWLGEGKVESAMRDWLERAFGTSKIKDNIWRAPSAVVGPYAEGDIDLPLRIFAKQRVKLEAQNLWRLFELESQLIPLLLAMRQRGVRIDVAKAEALKGRLQTDQVAVEAKIKSLTGAQPNIWSAASLATVFDSEGIAYPLTPVRANGKGGAPSFRKEWLEHQEHPLAKLVGEARALDKFRGTFVEGYLLEGSHNGRIHCNFNQLRSDKSGTVSGRFSSSHPNLQNIPVRTAVGQEIREAFLAELGQTWWKFDWSQVEYRLIVHYAAALKCNGAEAVAQRYVTDPDVDYHQVIADMLGWTGKDGRARAKTLNFGLAYGQGVDLLCYKLGVDRFTGEKIINEYHRRSPFIRQLSNRLIWLVTNGNVEEGRAPGYVLTKMKRRRRFNTWSKGKNYFDVLEGEDPPPGSRRAFMHKVLNALIQGSAADIMKIAMVKCWNAGLFAPGVLGAPHLTVHDELDGSFDPSPATEEALAEVRHIMETCVKLKVPLKADGGRGPNWGLAK